MRSAAWEQPQLEGLGFAGRKDLFVAQVVAVHVFFVDEPGERLFDQRAAGHAQQGGGGEVGFQDQAVLAEGDIAHGRQVVEVEIAGAGDVQCRLGAAQFLVLALQLDLVNAQLVERLLHFRRSEGREGFRRLGGVLPGGRFGLLARLGGRDGTEFRVIHAKFGSWINCPPKGIASTSPGLRSALCNSCNDVTM